MKCMTKLTLLAIAGTLSACGTATSNRSLDSVHQPIVRSETFVFDATPVGGDFDADTQARLDGWLHAMNAGYGDRIAVEDTSSYGNTTALRTLSRIVGRYGLLVSEGAPVTAGYVPAGGMRITLTRASARVPGCPDWSSKYDKNFMNATSSHYGCATNGNMAAMVADPNDFVKGARAAEMDPSAATKPIKVFRERAPSGAGNIKDGGGAAGGGV